MIQINAGPQSWGHCFSMGIMGIRLRSIAAWMPLVVLLTPGLALGQAPSAATSPAFAQGLADRQAWETWFAGLSGEFRMGAEFWTGQRSKPHPAPCFASGGRDLAAWSEGCVAAQQLLAASDVRRKSEPDYRLGWNSFTPSPGAAIGSSGRSVPNNLETPSGEAPASAARAYVNPSFKSQQDEILLEEYHNTVGRLYVDLAIDRYAFKCGAIDRITEVYYHNHVITWFAASWHRLVLNGIKIAKAEIDSDYNFIEANATLTANSLIEGDGCDRLHEYPEIVTGLRDGRFFGDEVGINPHVWITQ